MDDPRQSRAPAPFPHWWHPLRRYRGNNNTMTLTLLLGGLALFALCFRAIDWFEKI